MVMLALGVWIAPATAIADGEPPWEVDPAPPPREEPPREEPPAATEERAATPPEPGEERTEPLDDIAIGGAMYPGGSPRAKAWTDILLAVGVVARVRPHWLVGGALEVDY